MSALNMSASTIKRLRPAGLVAGFIVLALALLGLWLYPAQFWRAYLLAYVFWLQIGLGCLGLVMLHHLVGGRWSATIRRVMEIGAMTLPLMAILFVPLLFGLTTLYPWANPEHLQHSEHLQAKTPYLNVPFFVLRAVVYFAVWTGLAYFLHRWSLEQDQAGEPGPGARMRRLSAIGMVLYILTATFAAYDWLMSLEPEWFSSGYGLSFIAGQATAALAVAIIGLRSMAKEHSIADSRLQSFNDLGNFLLGFIMIWAYFAFSQFLIIWSANLPEEAVWYVHRSQGGWLQVGLILIAVHFGLPFFLLLSRRVKRTAQWLTLLAGVILLARLVDLIWLIMPAFYPQGVYIHWLDLTLLAVIGAGWTAVFRRQWSGKSPLPVHDFHLETSELEAAAREVTELEATGESPSSSLQ